MPRYRRCQEENKDGRVTISWRLATSRKGEQKRQEKDSATDLSRNARKREAQALPREIGVPRILLAVRKMEHGVPRLRRVPPWIPDGARRVRRLLWKTRRHILQHRRGVRQERLRRGK